MFRDALACAAVGLLFLAPVQADDADAVAAAAAPRVQYVTMKTNSGDMLIMLDRESAPLTVENFMTYVKDGHYDGTIFHRVIPGFMIQGGGFTSDMSKLETRQGVQNEYGNGLTNTRYTLAMARVGGQPNSGTSQFFINVKDNPNLDKKQADGAAYAVFGKVVDGANVAETIKSAPTSIADNGMRDVPVSPVVIESVKPITRDEALKQKPDLKRIESDWYARRDQTRKADAELAKRAARRSKTVDQVLKNPTEIPGEAVTGDASKQDSGLVWFDLKEGDGASPAGPTSTVTVHYTGWLVDGTKFDSSVDRGESIDFPLNRVIAAWTEGVQSMKIGGKRKLVVPASLGYGARGTPGGPIPPNATLVFDVELLGVQD